MRGKISLVGAGPGDPELMTLKGLQVLKSADVILYDALVNTDLFAFLPPYIEKIFVGKRAGKHSLSQDEINHMLIAQALSGHHVVRLKGGDPFVFGRGYEELQYASSFGIPVEVVPGLSSATSLTALQHIPLTHRGISSGFWVLTATRAGEEFSKQLELAMGTDATIIILMGMRKLPMIIEVFKNHGKAALPMMVIQNGSLPGEKKVVARAEDLLDKVKKAHLSTPAVIIAGEVVGLDSSLGSKAHAHLFRQYSSFNYE